MRMLLSDFVLFSCLAAFVTGLVIAAATLLIQPHCSFLDGSLVGALRPEPSSLPPPLLANAAMAASRVAAQRGGGAVVLDFVQPPGPSGRLVSWAGQAGLTEVGEGYATLSRAEYAIE